MFTNMPALSPAQITLQTRPPHTWIESHFWHQCRRRSGGGRTTYIDVIVATWTTTAGRSAGTYQQSRAAKSTVLTVSILTIRLWYWWSPVVRSYSRDRSTSTETGAAVPGTAKLLSLFHNVLLLSETPNNQPRMHGSLAFWKTRLTCSVTSRFGCSFLMVSLNIQTISYDTTSPERHWYPRTHPETSRPMDWEELSTNHQCNGAGKPLPGPSIRLQRCSKIHIDVQYYAQSCEHPARWPRPSTRQPTHQKLPQWETETPESLYWGILQLLCNSHCYPPMRQRLILSRPSRVSWQHRLPHRHALLICVILLWKPADYITRTRTIPIRCNKINRENMALTMVAPFWVSSQMMHSYTQWRGWLHRSGGFFIHTQPVPCRQICIRLLSSVMCVRSWTLTLNSTV